MLPEAIFDFYVEPATWGSRGHNARWARARGPVVEGSIVDVKAGYGKVNPVLMRRVIENRYVECEIHPPVPGHDQTALHDRVRQIGTVAEFLEWFDIVRGNRATR